MLVARNQLETAAERVPFYWTWLYVLAGIPLCQIRENSNFLKIKSCYQFFSSSLRESIVLRRDLVNQSLGKEEDGCISRS